VQQSVSFMHDAPTAVSEQGWSALEQATTTKKDPKRKTALRIAAQP